MDIEIVGSHVVEASLELHRKVGPGLLEDVYETLLAESLERRGLHVDRQIAMPVTIDGHHFGRAMRLDLLVDKQVVLELKSQERVTPFHFKQVLTYLRLLDFRLGYLINFGCGTLKEGLHRIVNNYQPTASSPLRVNRRPLPIIGTYNDHDEGDSPPE